MSNRITPLLDTNGIPVNVRQCQRCGYDHTILFRPLTNAADRFAHWGMCEKTREPVLLSITDGDRAGRRDEAQGYGGEILPAA